METGGRGVVQTLDFPAILILVSLELLHPEEEPLGRLKLENIDPSTGALRHLLELLGKIIKSSSLIPEVLSFHQK